ncbi:hypothetical protein J1N35_036767 [Gossypium stocksii]|uniref:MULE transposase domain-containing protein n=1 Tax=Gossypium stocksii TaxID=47602 RepID=A0A9D3UIW2_9ROSI|nr:hypothetical protein J1N35_036767 [Gossypium stocksii]
MREYVPGTVIELQTRPYYGLDERRQPGKRIFQRIFWTFNPCMRAFPHCKPFVQVDETWLYGKYTQILLIAITQDGNKNVLPIAFAIVDKENMESWEFFLTNLRRLSLRSNNHKLGGGDQRCVVENVTSSDFICLLSYILQVGYLDAKNGSATSQPDERPLVVNPVYHLGPMELVSEIDAAIAGACAKVLLNVDQFIDEVYTLERTLCVWENEFPVLPDLSTWEVPRMNFELIPDNGLRRNPKSRPQSSRIRNEMDIREKSDEKLCGLCRVAGHNRSKCPLRNYHTGQSSRSDRN